MSDIECADHSLVLGSGERDKPLPLLPPLTPTLSPSPQTSVTVSAVSPALQSYSVPLPPSFTRQPTHPKSPDPFNHTHSLTIRTRTSSQPSICISPSLPRRRSVRRPSLPLPQLQSQHQPNSIAYSRDPFHARPSSLYHLPTGYEPTSPQSRQSHFLSTGLSGVLSPQSLDNLRDTVSSDSKEVRERLDKLLAAAAIPSVPTHVAPLPPLGDVSSARIHPPQVKPPRPAPAPPLGDLALIQELFSHTGLHPPQKEKPRWGVGSYIDLPVPMPMLLSPGSVKEVKRRRSLIIPSFLGRERKEKKGKGKMLVSLISSLRGVRGRYKEEERYIEEEEEELVELPPTPSSEAHVPSTPHTQEQEQEMWEKYHSLVKHLSHIASYRDCAEQGRYIEEEDVQMPPTPAASSEAHVSFVPHAQEQEQEIQKKDLLLASHALNFPGTISKTSIGQWDIKNNAGHSNDWPTQFHQLHREVVDTNGALFNEINRRGSSDTDLFSDACNILRTVFLTKTKYRKLLHLEQSSAQLVLDVIQTILDYAIMNFMDSEFQNMLLKAMLRLSKRSTLCPRSYVLSGIERDEYPIASGHFGEIFQGDYNGRKVSLKVFKLYSNQMSKINDLLQAFYKEAILWRHLVHPNLLPFYGIYQLGDSGGRICLVSPWMKNGNITQYLQRYPDANRRHLVLDIAQGVAYLHERSIVHGDLKGVNVLVSDKGIACLADFGLSSIIHTHSLAWTSIESTVSNAGTVRWQAPELIEMDDTSDIGVTRESDIYAFACVCYEIFIGRVPFYQLGFDAAVIRKIMLGQRPLRPESNSPPYTVWGLSDWTWSLIEECWCEEPANRPKSTEVVGRLSSKEEFRRGEVNNQYDWGDLQPEVFRSLLDQRSPVSDADIRCSMLLLDSL